jgi:hypothetical protein
MSLRAIVVLGLVAAVGCKKTAPAYTEPKQADNAPVKPLNQADASYEMSLEGFEQACEEGSAESCYLAAKVYTDGPFEVRDGIKARARLERACEGRVVPACNDLAQLLIDKSLGDPDDLVRAISIFRSACDKGDGLACSNLGRMIFLGRGTKADPAEGARLYEKACGMKTAYACFNLARALDRGTGVKQDKARAVQFYERACDQNLAEGCMNLGVKLLKAEGVGLDSTRALALTEKACSMGQATACLNAGVMYRKGQGAAPDEKKVIQFFTLACKGGEQKACEAQRAAGASP